MTTTERRAITLQRRQRHIESLQKLGYIYDKMNAIKRLENKANYIQTMDCNGELTESEVKQHDLKITSEVKRLFGGNVPKGFFINGDARGYALKIDTEAWKVSDNATENYNAQPIKYTDWGDDMILAPEEF